MKFDDATIKKILLGGNYISGDDAVKAEKYAKERGGSPLSYLLSEGLISEKIIGQAIAEYFGVPYSDLKAHEPPIEQISAVPEDVAKQFRAVLFKRNKMEAVIATDEPKTTGMKAALAKLFPGLDLKITFSLPEEIDLCLSRYHQKLETRFAQIIDESKGEVVPEVAPKIVAQIFEDAMFLKASDIHFEPQEDKAVVRFRIDGMLREVGNIPTEYFANIINRLKVMAKLRIDEHYAAQDGAIRYVSDTIPFPVDLRLSIVPTMDGEKVAVRVLSSYVRDLTLNDIGLSERLQTQILKSAKKPFGMILVTGPTGSGKSTTLYTLLKDLNTRRVNITTIEDPVEYRLKGVNQIQVNVATNLTFAKGLRAIVRQDPNIILVGEIRDQETADIAVNAALTGHLLFSTFHANNVATSIPRFIDMGVEPFLLGSTLELVIAQRLVRRICESCKVSYNLSKSEIGKYGSEFGRLFPERSHTFYKGKGCPACGHSGYRGRIGVYEFVNSTPELQDLIAKRPSTREVEVLIRSQGYPTMFEDGIEKVKSGVTTIEEVLRVVGSH